MGVYVRNLTLRPDSGIDASRRRRGDSYFLEPVWGEVNTWVADCLEYVLGQGKNHLLWLCVRNYVLSLTPMRDLLYSLLKGGFRGQRRCHRHYLKIYHDRIFPSIKGTYFLMAVFLFEVLLQWRNWMAPSGKACQPPLPICHWEQVWAMLEKLGDLGVLPLWTNLIQVASVVERGVTAKQHM